MIKNTNLKTIRVLHLNTMLRGGGTDDQCVKVVAGVRKLGVDARIMGPEGREFCSHVSLNQIPLIPAPVSKISFMLAAAKEIRQGGYDIIHAHHGRDYWPTFIAVALSMRRPKIVFTRHLAKSPRSFPSRFFLLKLCDHVIAVSEFTAIVMKQGFDDPNSPEPERHHRSRLLGDYSKISVIPCGIDVHRFHPGVTTDLRSEWHLSPEHYVFAVVGGYDHPRGKGQREFLKAAAQIHQQAPQARFLIIGRGTLTQTLQEDIQRLGLQEKAFLIPYCNDMPAVMHSINCLVHPAIGTESFGLVLLEAFACGRPVIASALDGIPEAFNMVGEGKLVPPEDIHKLATAMAEMAFGNKFPSSEKQIAMHQLVVQKGSLELVARRTVDLYRQLL